MAQPPSLRAQFPSGPLIDETGEITPVWRAYFSQLYIRTGGAAGASSDTTQLQADLDAEEAARQAADLVLTTGLVAERTAREAADSAEAAARAQADAQMLPKAGGTMTGNIILPAVTPTLPRQAVSKSYVDGAVGAGGGVDSFNTRTGAVTLSGADITGAGGALLLDPVFVGNPRVPTATVGDADTTAASTAFVAVAAAPAQNNSGRNLLHNGLFNVAQRGVGPWTAGGYTLDRWQLSLATDVVSVTQGIMSDAGRAGVGDETARFFLFNNFTGNAAAGAFNRVIQRIEGVHRLAGKTVIVSFWANSVTGLKLGVSLAQTFGSGGSPSASVLIAAQSVTTALAWTRYSLTFTLPSVAGKTLGTAGDDSTTLYLWYSCGATFNAQAGSIGVQSGAIALWGVQLEIAAAGQTQPTPLDKPDPQVDLTNCQRFYQVGSVQFGGYGTAGMSANHAQTFVPQFRATPTVTPTLTTQTNCTGSFGAIWRGHAAAGAVVTATGAFQLVGSFAASADL